jgi:ketosteroid isomerase-like protein
MVEDMTKYNLVRDFYEAFIKGNAAAMSNCYSDDVHFEDPAFGILKGNEAKAMWEMLIKSSKGALKVTYSDIEVNGNTGKAKWKAEYKFSQTGREVVNHITSNFEFANGKIVKHIDKFNLWKWSQQALGTIGFLFGWSQFFKKNLQKKTNLLLRKYMNS